MFRLQYYHRQNGLNKIETKKKKKQKNKKTKITCVVRTAVSVVG